MCSASQQNPHPCRLQAGGWWAGPAPGGLQAVGVKGRPSLEGQAEEGGQDQPQVGALQQATLAPALSSADAQYPCWPLAGQGPSVRQRRPQHRQLPQAPSASGQRKPSAYVCPWDCRPPSGPPQHPLRSGEGNKEARRDAPGVLPANRPSVRASLHTWGCSHFTTMQHGPTSGCRKRAEAHRPQVWWSFVTCATCQTQNP